MFRDTVHPIICCRQPRHSRLGIDNADMRLLDLDKSTAEHKGIVKKLTKSLFGDYIGCSLRLATELIVACKLHVE